MPTIEELDAQIDALNYAFDMISEAYNGKDPKESETEEQSNHRTTLIEMKLKLLQRKKHLLTTM